MPTSNIPSAPGPDETVNVTLTRDDLGALLKSMWRTLGWEAPTGAHTALQALRTAYLHPSPSSAVPSPLAPAPSPTAQGGDGCMPHQRLPCGHCTHQACQVCARCCSCRCGQTSVSKSYLGDDTPGPTPAAPAAETEDYPGELTMLRGLLGALHTTARNTPGMNEVRRLLDEHTRDASAL